MNRFPIPLQFQYLEGYNAGRAGEEGVGDLDDRVKSLENQVDQLRAFTRALVEHLAAHSKLTPHDFLQQLAHDHPAPGPSETVHCKFCGTLIASDAKACYSCGKKVDTETYILS